MAREEGFDLVEVSGRCIAYNVFTWCYALCGNYFFSHLKKSESKANIRGMSFGLSAQD
jgi:hypothetical protein